MPEKDKIDELIDQYYDGKLTINEMLHDDEAFKVYVILKLYDLDYRISQMESFYSLLKKALVGILSILGAKIGIDLTGGVS